MVGRIIESEADLAEGAAFLAAAEPRFAMALRLTGPLRLRRKSDGFAELLATIVGQQVSVAAAGAIWARVEALGIVEAELIDACSDPELRACGLSRQKIAAARAISGSGIDFSELRDLPDDEVIARLVRIRGVGLWTAQIYTMLSLGRADVFAPGDIALRDAAGRIFGLPARPSERILRGMSRAWSPWRSAAAVLMWQFYRVTRLREGIG